MQKYILLIFALFQLPTGNTQVVKVVSDFRFQTELGIEKKLFNNWALEFENTYKWIEDASRLDEIDFDFNLGYKPYKFMKLSAGYRFRLDMKKKEGYNKEHRYSFDVSLRHRFGRFTPVYRIRYQNMDDDYIPFKDISQEVHILRNRIMLYYDIKQSKLTPFANIELYGRLSEYYPFAMRFKTALGCRYRFERFGTLQTAYRIDRELNTNYPYTYYNLEIGYSYTF